MLGAIELDKAPDMLLIILQHTPIWVFLLLAYLLYAGYLQTRPREVPLARVLILPLVMLGLSLGGLASAFGSALAFACWGGGLVIGLSLWQRRGGVSTARYLPQQRRFWLPGSRWPMLVMLLIFCSKYAVAISLARSPALAQQRDFVMTIALLYGLFSSYFAARLLLLLRLTVPARPT